MPYHIIWYPDTREHFRYLTARQRSIVFDSVEEQLVNEPTAETRNRKEMRLLSRDRHSSEQFAGLNRRYDEMQAEFACVSLATSETSQEEAL